jgi:predicted nicotinamide N-methyase
MTKAETLERTAERQAADKLARCKAFVLAQTEIGSAALVPEVKLRLAREAREIFIEAETFMDSGLGSRPYWSFAWPGGQGLARMILDEPELVAGKRVLDIGAGSGLGGIAALKAGAKSVLAADIDPLAHAASILNAELNDVQLQATMTDLLGELPDADIVLIGDLVYEPDLQIRVGALLDMTLAAGIPVLYGDRTTARRPRQDFVLLKEYEAPLMPALVEDFIERSRVWRLG